MPCQRKERNRSGASVGPPTSEEEGTSEDGEQGLEDRGAFIAIEAYCCHREVRVSLSDALLLEPPLPAIQTPVVIRPDFLTTFGDPSEAVAIAPNPFKEGDTIIVSGVTGAGAEVWNGVFAIYSVFPSVFRYRMNQVPAAPPGDYDYITAVRILYQEVYIALRTDGQLGSGTQADPWNGSAVSASVNPPFEIKQLKFVTLSNPERYLATAVTNDNHPFVAGDYITVAGVDSGAGLGDPKLSDSYYMGTYRL